MKSSIGTLDNWAGDEVLGRECMCNITIRVFYKIVGVEIIKVMIVIPILLIYILLEIIMIGCLRMIKLLLVEKVTILL